MADLPTTTFSPEMQDFLMKKYPDQFADLVAKKEAAAADFEQARPEMGPGGSLLTGLRAALSGDSYENLKKLAFDQRQKERAAVMQPFAEKEADLTSKFSAGKNAFDMGQTIAKAPLELQGLQNTTGTSSIALKEAEQDQDPNSPYAPVMKNLLAKAMRKDPSDPMYANLSPAQMTKMLGGAEKLASIDSNLEYRKMLFDARTTAAKDREKTKNDTELDKMRAKFKDDMDPNKARGGALAQTQQRLNRAHILEALMNDPRQAGNLDQRQIEEAAIGLNALLSGSNTGAQEQVKALVPRTAWGNAMKIMEWWKNEPTGTGQQAFVKRLYGTVERERKIAEDLVKEAQVQRIPAHKLLREKDPESYNEILSSYGIDPATDIDEKGRYKYKAIGAKGPLSEGASGKPKMTDADLDKMTNEQLQAYING